MDTTVQALIRDAWFKDIDPEDVTSVLNSEGIDVSLDTVRALYREWYIAIRDRMPVL